MKTIFSLALLTMVASSVQCSDLQITIESDTWCTNEKYFKDKMLETYIEDNAHCDIANHLLLRKKHGKELHKIDGKKILDYLRRENRQKKEDLKKAKKLNKKASALSSLVNNKPIIRNEKNECDTHIANYIKEHDGETLKTYISEIEALDTNSNKAAQDYVDTLYNECNMLEKDMEKKESSIKSIESSITSRVREENGYCNGCCVTGPSCGDKVTTFWGWVLCCPVMVPWWAYRQAAHRSCPFKLHVYE